jgi:hypothetical protein
MMASGGNRDALRWARLLILGVLAVLFVAGMAVVALAIVRAGEPATARPVDALARSDDECVVCHRRTSRHRRAVRAQQHGGCRGGLPRLP